MEKISAMKMPPTSAPDLFSVLDGFHPIPWTVLYHANRLDGARADVRGIMDASGGWLLECETFTGDGDQVRMSAGAMEALVSFINSKALK